MYKKLMMIILSVTITQPAIPNNLVVSLQNLRSSLKSLQQLLLQKQSKIIEEKVITGRIVEEWVKETRDTYHISEGDLSILYGIPLTTVNIIFYGPLFGGHRTDPSPNCFGYDQLKRKEFAANYKIHLMPKNSEDFKKIIQRLIVLVKENEKLKESLTYFKVINNMNFGELSMEDYLKKITRNKGVMPIMVLYPASGKRHAQTVLDIVYKEFGKMKGLDITPRFNEKVTSLIYFAQGDGDYKAMEEYEHYFEPPYLIYYRHTFENPKNTDKRIYWLKNPTRRRRHSDKAL